MSEDKFSQEQIEKNKRGQESLERSIRQEQEKLEKKIAKAPLIGKEPFNLDKLKKYWSYRYERTSTPDEINRAMKEIERDYYLSWQNFMTMEEYGKHLMEMELYR